MLKWRHALLLNCCTLYGERPWRQTAQRYGISLGFIKVINLKQRCQVTHYWCCYVDFENAVRSFVIFQFKRWLFMVVLLVMTSTVSSFTASCLFPSTHLTYAYLQLQLLSVWKHIKNYLSYGIYTNITLDKPLIICIWWAVRSVLSACWRLISFFVFHLVIFTGSVLDLSFHKIHSCKSCVFLGSPCRSFMYLKSTFYQRRRSSLAERFAFKGNRLTQSFTQPNSSKGLTLILDL